MVIITGLYYRLIFLPIEVTYYSFKFSADILFNHGLNSVVLEELQSLENLSILENLAITWPYTAPRRLSKSSEIQFRLASFSFFNLLDE